MARTAQTISEKILSAKTGREVRAGEIVIARVDRVIGTDASSPMAIDYFERMGGQRLFDPARAMFALDQGRYTVAAGATGLIRAYRDANAPPASDATRAFHQRIRSFAQRHGAELFEAGEGISFQRAMELGRVLPGELVIGADSHTVTCGALNLFATGVGSSDLAAALLTGAIWLRVPESIKVVLSGIQTPRMNSIMERWVRTCRHELLDRTLIWNQRHLLHALHEFECFYNGLTRASPTPDRCTHCPRRSPTQAT